MTNTYRHTLKHTQTHPPNTHTHTYTNANTYTGTLIQIKIEMVFDTTAMKYTYRNVSLKTVCSDFGVFTVM